jgi:hypothetical protein
VLDKLIGVKQMARVTREQVEKWNKQALNGFRLDLSMLMYHNEKDLEKIVKVDDTKHIRYRLSFWEVRKNYRFSHYVVKLNKSIWTTNREGGMATSHGLGYNVVVSEKEYSKKNFKELCTISGQLPEDLETLYTANTEDAGRGMVLSSPLN